jgi:NaMN:DMB phosphoribosyltransferase
VIANAGDPMIPFVAGMLNTASEATNVILAGGTQMAAVIALAKSTGYNENCVAIGTTSYIIDDKDANLLDMIKSISNIPVLSINLKLEDSKFSGLRAYSEGFVKEGVGAGGSVIASMLKTGADSQRLLEAIDKEYQQISSSK